MRIGLLGDVMLGRGVAEALASTPGEELWSEELRELTGACDAVVCNLECCISERGAPTGAIRGKPFFFRAPPRALEALGAIGVRAVSLANNHALDYGKEALADTSTHLEAAGIVAVGAGAGRAAARRGGSLEVGGRRLGVVAVADGPPEFAATASGELGIAYADLGKGAPKGLEA